MKFVVWIVQAPGHAHARCFMEVAEGVAWALRQLGHDVVEPQVVGDYVVNADPAGRRPIVLATNFLPDVALSDDAIIYNLEPVYDGEGAHGTIWRDLAVLRLMRRHTVWDYNQTNVLRLRSLGVEDVHYCGIGYAAPLERVAPGVVQDIDVLHYGTLAPRGAGAGAGARRRDVLDALADMTVHDADGTERPLRVEHVFGTYGPKLDEYIARAKVVVNIHHFLPTVFEIVRCSYLFMNKKCVVTESGGSDHEWERFASQAAAYVPFDKIPDVCRMLVDEKEGGRIGDAPATSAEVRGAVAARGYEMIRRIDQVEYVRRALESCA